MCAQDRCGLLPECDVYLWCPANLHQLQAPITPALCYEVSINGASGQPHGRSTVHYPAQKCPAFPLLCAKVSSSSHDGVSPTRSPTGPLICTLQLLPPEGEVPPLLPAPFFNEQFPKKEGVEICCGSSPPEYLPIAPCRDVI